MSTAPPMELYDTALTAAITDGLALVEQRLQEASASQNKLLAQTSVHLIDAGGKRFRPTLTLLAARFGDPSDRRIVPAAAAIELTHLATLYHDDVMDEAEIRRGQPSANSKWTNTVAILTGDFLFARASQLLADIGTDAVRIQADTFTRLVRGQIAETVGPQPGEDPLAHYLMVAQEKTASLIGTAGQFGALFAGAPAEVVARVESACEAIGVAWQLSDDILDVASETDQSGKAPGTDLREGVQSLPVLYALRSGRPRDARLRELLAADLTDPALHAEALGLLRAHPAMDAARADARGWADAARADLLALPAGPARTALEALCDFVVQRTG